MTDEAKAPSQAPTQDKGKATFEQAAQEKSRGVVGEFIDFLMTSKKWWLTPIILVLLLIGAMIVLTGGAAAPFIYTLF